MIPDPDTSPRPTGAYEPPRIERVLAPADLEREVQYAGFDTVTPPPG